MWQDREHRFARGALHAPDRHPIQTDPDVMGVARQVPSRLTGGLVCKLKPEGHDEGDDTFDKRPAIAQQAKIGGFILEINGDGTVFPWWFGLASHGSPLGQMV
jgi:hypothetical protein